MYPNIRPRRLRQNAAMRSLVRETSLSVNDFIAPLFVVTGSGVKEPIDSLDGQFRFSPDQLVEEVFGLKKLGIKSVLLFGLPDKKDDCGAVSYQEDGVVQQAIQAIKKDIKDVVVMADLCFCEYTTHGHCGVLVDGEVDNDLTLIETARQAVSLARAGADVIAPSGMMDGMVGTIRGALDEVGHKNTVILSYAAKYASAFYGPFRDAVKSSPSFGDRQSYQMDPANSDEALREVALDIEEGADIVMVKPALAYLDIIARVKDQFSIPLAAYSVSGEYAMIKAAAKQNLIDENRVVLETLCSIKRAGADMIISYFAKDVAKQLTQ
jgi:porphobilinogen synthase